jgi:hypothetical protein
VYTSQACSSHIAYISLAYNLDRSVALIRHASDFEEKKVFGQSSLYPTVTSGATSIEQQLLPLILAEFWYLALGAPTALEHRHHRVKSANVSGEATAQTGIPSRKSFWLSHKCVLGFQKGSP